MNKLFLISCFLFLSFANAQNNKISIEADLIGFRDLIDKSKNKYSPGFSLLIHKKIDKIKISWGINFATRNFSYAFSDPMLDYNKWSIS